jgi:hypothetical protein
MLFRLTVAVLGLAVPAALTACASRADRVGTRSNDASLVGVVGYRWRITEILHGAAAVTIPRRHDAYIALTADGSPAADDTLSPYFGSFTPTATGYHVTVMMVGQAGYRPRPRLTRHHDHTGDAPSVSSDSGESRIPGRVLANPVTPVN